MLFSNISLLCRSLQNHRTRIHRNLFAAIGIQVIVRLTLYIDQYITNTNANHQKAADSQPHYGIHTTVRLLIYYHFFLLFLMLGLHIDDINKINSNYFSLITNIASLVGNLLTLLFATLITAMRNIDYGH